MKTKFKKYTYWVGIFSLYLFFVSVTLVLLFNFDREHDRNDSLSSATTAQSQTSQSFLSQFTESRDFSAVLLPLGPDDGQLPGLPAVWAELEKVHRTEFEEHDFTGIQVVRNVSDFAKGPVSELFLSGRPISVFRKGNTLIELNSAGILHFIDCRNPHSPELFKTYTQYSVSHIALKDELAFLLLKDDRLPYSEIAVLNLSNPEAPVEVKRLKLTEKVKTFFFMKNLMVAYETVNGIKDDHVVHVYQVTDGFNLVSLGQAQTPPFGKTFAQIGDYVVFPDPRDGLKVYDFTNPLNPALASSINLSSHVSRLVRFGNDVFTLSDNKTLSVVHMDDPTHPKLRANFEKGEAFAYIMEWGDNCYYFTSTGYLLVFDTPFSAALARQRSSKTSPIPADFVLPGNEGMLIFLQKKGMGPSATSLTRILPESVPSTHDALLWGNTLVVLDEEGTAHFLREGDYGEYRSLGRLTLPFGQRWLAAGDDRLFVGGGKMVYVITEQKGQFIQSQQFPVDGGESWDGLVSRRTLYVAAGRNGVLAFPVQHPDQEEELALPMHLQSLVDASQLAITDDDRVLVAAGWVGLLVISNDDTGEMQLTGRLEFAAPARALAGVGEMCVVATDDGVYVVDIRDKDSLQPLGRIEYRGVERFAVGSDEDWAGYSPGYGWRLLPKPRLMSVDDLVSLKGLQSNLGQKDLHTYRINLFSDQKVISAPGVMSLSLAPINQNIGAGHVVN